MLMRLCLLCARMTRKVVDAELSGRLHPDDISPGDLLSGSACPKSVSLRMITLEASPLANHQCRSTLLLGFLYLMGYCTMGTFMTVQRD
ncbi:hypothetical protein SMACR_12762 [Sordaria macrospora]|uniref:WGS project CABT00000000 data, contig 2.30 n=2 Tax=Sordaria macrospora TaxID=5147 RepID=F7W5F3_SORMK|nr:uncharacterized protein SMAC_12762 [Sordaria macrospora k-hell]KAA8632518.1 hypothetical protein SMACR_12762 [Sordaria macrospora]KAH7628044.1 hypothetical protein B0T09DRAFT_269194 [Sordaria sp. MPI-SDFR-AT-0083]WPJ65494.1 hypothetical protein SMAC4_12762 [Sordaria macrospora]CCC12741.1 unnamed protein product [Sordaria macrospora k-hell]